MRDLVAVFQEGSDRNGIRTHFQHFVNSRDFGGNVNQRVNGTCRKSALCTIRAELRSFCVLFCPKLLPLQKWHIRRRFTCAAPAQEATLQRVQELSLLQSLRKTRRDVRCLQMMNLRAGRCSPREVKVAVRLNDHFNPILKARVTSTGSVALNQARRWPPRATMLSCHRPERC